MLKFQKTTYSKNCRNIPLDGVLCSLVVVAVYNSLSTIHIHVNRFMRKHTHNRWKQEPAICDDSNASLGRIVHNVSTNTLILSAYYITFRLTVLIPFIFYWLSSRIVTLITAFHVKPIISFPTLNYHSFFSKLIEIFLYLVIFCWSRLN